MKRILLILSIIILTATSVCAQANPYTPDDDYFRLERALGSPTLTTSPYAATSYDAYPTPQSTSGRRNAVGDDPFGGGDIGDVEDPKEPTTHVPMGDIPTGLLLLFATMYILIAHRHTTQPNH